MTVILCTATCCYCFCYCCLKGQVRKIMHSFWRLFLLASEIGSFQFHFAKNKNAECRYYSCTDSCVHGIGNYSKYPRTKWWAFSIPFLVKGHLQISVVKGDRWHKKHISRLRPTGHLLNSLTLPFFIRSFHFEILLFPTIQPGPRLLP